MRLGGTIISKVIIIWSEENSPLLEAKDLLFTYMINLILWFRPKKMEWKIVVYRQEMDC